MADYVLAFKNHSIVFAYTILSVMMMDPNYLYSINKELKGGKPITSISKVTRA